MKLIPLSKSKYGQMFATVDDSDYEWISGFKWAAKKGGAIFYAVTTQIILGKERQSSMHRMILGITDPKIHVDHRNGDGLDNQRGNIRAATCSQNRCNSVKKSNSKTSLYKGVCKLIDRRRNKEYVSYRSSVTFNGKRFLLGHFKTEIEAALAYNNGAIKLHGEFAKINIIH